MRYPFTWTIEKDGKTITLPQENLIAVIPGSLKGTANQPVLIAAQVLKNLYPKHDIWLTHLTGEEYPADDLGIRALLSDHLKGRSGWSAAMKELMGKKEDFSGMVLMDMIGFYRSGENSFQVNLGSAWQDGLIGRIALDAAARYAPGLKPLVRNRFDRKSYLYNTDGYIYDNCGYPVVFFDEDIDRDSKFTGNPNYHQSQDLTRHLDLEYAQSIGKTAIATVAHLALIP